MLHVYMHDPDCREFPYCREYLEHSAEVLVRELCHRQAVWCLLGPQPGAALSLGIDQHQRPRCPRDHDAVLDRQLIIREALRVEISRFSSDVTIKPFGA